MWPRWGAAVQLESAYGCRRSRVVGMTGAFLGRRRAAASWDLGVGVVVVAARDEIPVPRRGDRTYRSGRTPSTSTSRNANAPAACWPTRPWDVDDPVAPLPGRADSLPLVVGLVPLVVGVAFLPPSGLAVMFGCLRVVKHLGGVGRFALGPGGPLVRTGRALMRPAPPLGLVMLVLVVAGHRMSLPAGRPLTTRDVR